MRSGCVKWLRGFFVKPAAGRIQMLDAYRGLCLVMMVVYHIMWNLVYVAGGPQGLFTSPVLDVIRWVVAASFIVLCGISSRFSRSNLKRGASVFLVAIAITVVTSLAQLPIYFGALHLLGLSMMIYGLTWRMWQRVPEVVLPLVCLALIVLSWVAVRQIPVGMDAVYAKFLWFFGWNPGYYNSADYFPIFPWFFLFLLGTWAGKYVKEGALPAWFYEANAPSLAWVGRRTLVIYLVHEPVIYGIALWILHVRG